MLGGPVAAKIVARDVEKQLSDEEFIVSKTDLKSRIVYVNRTFMQISGFTEGRAVGRATQYDSPPGYAQGCVSDVVGNDQGRR